MVVRDISEAVTMSRFEATDPDHDGGIVQNLHVLIEYYGVSVGEIML